MVTSALSDRLTHWRVQNCRVLKQQAVSYALYPVCSEVNFVLFSLQKTYSWKQNGLSSAQHSFPKI